MERALPVRAVPCCTARSHDIGVPAAVYGNAIANRVECMPAVGASAIELQHKAATDCIVERTLSGRAVPGCGAESRDIDVPLLSGTMP